jgi:hypothetical protein
MAGTATISKIGQVLATLALTTSEDTYTLSFPALAQGATPVFVQFTADVNWFYALDASGPYYLIGAGVPFDLGPIVHGRVVYVKGQVAGTLYGIVKDGPMPALKTNS